MVLDENPREPFQRSEHSAMDHHGPLPGVVICSVEQVEVLGLGEVDLQRRELPTAPDGIPYMNVDLGSIEGAFALRDRVRQPGGLECKSKGLFSSVPELVASDVLLGVLGGQIGLEIREAKVAQHHQGEVEQVLQLGGDVRLLDEDVAVVLGEASGSHETVDDARSFIPINRP